MIFILQVENEIIFQNIVIRHGELPCGTPLKFYRRTVYNLFMEHDAEIPPDGEQPRRRGRPRKDAGEEDRRAHLVRTGMAVLTEKGFSAVGIDEILKLAGVPKGSFYYYFDSKEAFGAVLVEAYARYFADKLDRFFRDDSVSPLQRLQNFVDNACQGMARHDFRRGCLAGNLGQETGTLPPAMRDQICDVFRDWQARTAACLLAARAAGEIPAGADCDRLAELFWIGWEGAVLRAKLERSAAPLQIFTGGFFALLCRPGG